MSEQSMSDFLSEKIEEWIAAHGGGFLTGYVAMIDMVSSDGPPRIFVAGPSDQATYRTQGMVAYLHEWFADDARRSWVSSAPCDDCEDD